MAILNIGHYVTHSRIVNTHTAGSNRFSYDADFLNGYLEHPHFWSPYFQWNQRYYLEGKLSFLDSPGEWFYDKTDGILYYWPENGKIQEGTLRGKIRSHALRIYDSKHIKISGFNFFGTTISADNADYITIEDCDFKYFAFNRRMLGVEDEYGDSVVSTIIRGDNTLIRNCTFEYCDGPAFALRGKGNRLENLLVHDINWTGLGHGMVDLGGCDKAVISRVTMYNGGESESLVPGKSSLIEFCDLGPDLGVMQEDGAIIQIIPSWQDGTVVRYTWVHHTHKFGIRADVWGPETDRPNAGNALFHHNVVWGNTVHKSQKPAIWAGGDSNRIFNNLSYDNEALDINIPLQADWKVPRVEYWNRNTLVHNNAAGEISGGRRTQPDVPLPGPSSNNFTGNVWSHVTDPENLDFRPKPGSELVDAGVELPGITDGYQGAAPDIGPYEYGDSSYWIPGYQAGYCSKPVPADGAAIRYTERDLIWLEGYRSMSSEVYFGTDSAGVAGAGRESNAFQGNRIHNIYQPDRLQRGMTYYWRVDAVREDGITKGRVWSFRII
jgi:hypothetical protein